MSLRRVVVIGTSGSGKTTLARALAVRLGLAHVEMDALQWGANWTPASTDVLRERVSAATAGDGWVVDGNYRSARGDLWDRADTIVWLDYALPLVLWRLTRRTSHRCWTRELMWGGCRERLAVQLFTRESIFWWAITTAPRRRREYPAMLAELSARGKAVLRFRRPSETQRWLERVERDPAR